MKQADVLPGKPFPLGATPGPDGVNFSVWSRDASAVELLLFDAVDSPRPSRVISLQRRVHRTYHYWHVLVPGLGPGQRYGWRAQGPFEPGAGLRFDGEKLLIDPYARAIDVPPGYDRLAAARPGDNAAVAMKSVVADLSRFDWEGDQPPRRPFSQTAIYELHVRGFTRHPSSGVAEPRRGTYAGLVEKIPYLRSLGITAVELLPVFQYDPQDAPPGRINAWGYSPVSFFALHGGYAAATEPLAAIDEFREMVKALHRAGIEVLLDVVYNHTAETDERGPTLGFRGLDNRAYYLLDHDWSRYSNYTGCGNTLKAHHPVVRRLILDSLRYWVAEMHVDGFRFDLASVLSRDEAGNPMRSPPIVWEIESDPLLCGTKLIAEAWDAAGLYQVGLWVGDSWKEWNGHFRDDVRSFVRGEPGMVGRLANRIFASPDLYASDQIEPEQSVNFVTCHDGFTLNDLVSYDQKANLANGEGNRDGTDDNRSWNCGVEGPTDDPDVEALRARQVRNLLALTLLSSGVPMITMGDEARRTQLGNNNAWCLDGPISWLDWDTGGAPPRPAPLRAAAARPALRVRPDRGQRRRPAAGVPEPVPDRVARRAARRARLEPRVSQPGGLLHGARPVGADLRRLQRLLGAARLRAAGGAVRLAPAGGHGATVARGRGRLVRDHAGRRLQLPGLGALGGDAGHGRAASARRRPRGKQPGPRR